MRFKIDWASLIVRGKFTVFALFCFVFESNFQVQAPGRASIRRVDLTEVFCVTSLGGLFSEFYGNYLQLSYLLPCSAVWKCKRNGSGS